ncbi:MAG: hypothetical protein K0R63_1109 [Rickettsiales bacterium]|jgi:hypothetical protein|nr:hypothetical protein [Rickettsiales bacterium]
MSKLSDRSEYHGSIVQELSHLLGSSYTQKEEGFKLLLTAKTAVIKNAISPDTHFSSHLSTKEDRETFAKKLLDSSRDSSAILSEAFNNLDGGVIKKLFREHPRKDVQSLLRKALRETTHNPPFLYQAVEANFSLETLSWLLKEARLNVSAKDTNGRTIFDLLNQNSYYNFGALDTLSKRETEASLDEANTLAREIGTQLEYRQDAKNLFTRALNKTSDSFADKHQKPAASKREAAKVEKKNLSNHL